jgi:hypothetical protein
MMREDDKTETLVFLFSAPGLVLSVVTDANPYMCMSSPVAIFGGSRLLTRLPQICPMQIGHR